MGRGAWRRTRSGGGRSRGRPSPAGEQKKPGNSVRFNQPVRCLGAWAGCAEHSFGGAPVHATERKQHFVVGVKSEPAVEMGCTPPGVCGDVFFPFCFHLSVTLWLLENPVAQRQCLALLLLLLRACSQEGEARLWSRPCSCPRVAWAVGLDCESGFPERDLQRTHPPHTPCWCVIAAGD